MRNLKFYSCLFFLVFFLGNLSIRANIDENPGGSTAIYEPHKGLSAPFFAGSKATYNESLSIFAPSITQQPTDKSTCAGETVVFTVEAQGTGLSYRQWANTGYGWFELGNYDPYNGTGTNNLVVKNFNFSSAQTGYPLFRVVVTDNSSATTSNTVRLYQNTPASGWINAAYADRTICAGQSTFLRLIPAIQNQ